MQEKQIHGKIARNVRFMLTRVSSLSARMGKKHIRLPCGTLSDWSVNAMTKEVSEYFREQYGKASFRVVPGHWPDFKSKEEVDKWLVMMQKIRDFFINKNNRERESNDD
jgi:hypothetical protein